MQRKKETENKREKKHLNANNIDCNKCKQCTIANNGILDGVSFNEDFYPSVCKKFFVK